LVKLQTIGILMWLDWHWICEHNRVCGVEACDVLCCLKRWILVHSRNFVLEDLLALSWSNKGLGAVERIWLEQLEKVQPVLIFVCRFMWWQFCCSNKFVAFWCRILSGAAAVWCIWWQPT